MEWYQILSIVIATGMMVIGIITTHHLFKKAGQERHQKQMDQLIAHNEWRNNMELRVAGVERETAQLKEDGKTNLEDIWKSIECIEKTHRLDMVNADKQIEGLLKEIREQNSELTKQLTGISKALAVLTAQFQDHKETHKSDKKDV
jgi:hypothetical protein